MNIKPILIGALVLGLSACSSTPDPEPQPQEVAQPAPTPVPTAPPVAPPVTQPTEQVELPAVQGPIPGSVEDFLFMSGGEGRVFFAYDQFGLSNAARDTLRRQAQWLISYPNVTAVIEGNADERGTREYNLALAARRAESVKSFLVAQGVSPNRLTTVSYGKERPIDGRSNEEGWARNRNGHTNLMSSSIG